MNWALFVLALFLGEALIAIQGLAAWLDGYFSPLQMLEEGHQGYAFLQHGGMWADFFLITPLVAYLVGKYHFQYQPMMVLVFAVSMAVWLALAIFVYAPMGKIIPEAHANGGAVTIAGWIHILYAGVATGIVAMVYLPRYATPAVSGADIIIVSAVLLPWIVLGIMKFSPIWKWGHLEVLQVVGALISIVVITVARLS